MANNWQRVERDPVYAAMFGGHLRIWMLLMFLHKIEKIGDKDMTEIF